MRTYHGLPAHGNKWRGHPVRVTKKPRFIEPGLFSLVVLWAPSPWTQHLEVILPQILDLPDSSRVASLFASLGIDTGWP